MYWSEIGEGENAGAATFGKVALRSSQIGYASHSSSAHMLVTLDPVRNMMSGLECFKLQRPYAKCDGHFQ